MSDDKVAGRTEHCQCPPPTLSPSDVAHLTAETGISSGGVRVKDVEYGACLATLYSGEWDHYELLDVMLLAGYGPEVPGGQLALEAAFLVTKRKIQEFVDEGDVDSAQEWLDQEPRLLVQVATMLLDQAAELEAWNRGLNKKSATQKDMGCVVRDDVQPNLGLRYVAAEWRIQEFLSGWTHNLPLPAEGYFTDDDVLKAIAIEINQDYLLDCRIEFREMKSGDPWRVLHGGSDERSELNLTADILVRQLEQAQREGLMLSDAQRGRLALLLNGGAA